MRRFGSTPEAFRSQLAPRHCWSRGAAFVAACATVLGLVVVLPATATATAGAATSSSTTGVPTTSTTQTSGGSKRLTECVGGDCFFSRISGLIAVPSNVELKRFYVDRGQTEVCTNPAQDLPETVSGQSSWCVEVRDHDSYPDSRIVFYYEILKRVGDKWQNTGEYMDGYAKVPYVGENQLSCVIKNRETNADAGVASPYTCSYNWADSNPHSVDPQPHWTISAKPTVNVTDPQQAVDLLTKNCKAGHQTPECSYTATSQKVEAAPKDEWQLYGQPYANCSTKPSAPYSLEVEHKLSWEDSIAVKVGVEAEVIPEIVKASVDVEYKHKVGAEYSIKQSYHAEVEYRKLVGFYIQPGYLAIEGNFVVTTQSAVYRIDNFTLHLPLGEEYSPKGHPEVKIEPAVIYSVEIGDASCSSSGSSGVVHELHPGTPPPSGAVVLGKVDVPKS